MWDSKAETVREIGIRELLLRKQELVSGHTAKIGRLFLVESAAFFLLDPGSRSSMAAAISSCDFPVIDMAYNTFGPVSSFRTN